MNLFSSFLSFGDCMFQQISEDNIQLLTDFFEYGFHIIVKLCFLALNYISSSTPYLYMVNKIKNK